MKKISLLIIFAILCAALLSSCTSRMDSTMVDDTVFTDMAEDSMFEKDEGTVSDTDRDGLVGDAESNIPETDRATDTDNTTDTVTDLTTDNDLGADTSTIERMF